jgi:hypothetical protein
VGVAGLLATPEDAAAALQERKRRFAARWIPACAGMSGEWVGPFRYSFIRLTFIFNRPYKRLALAIGLAEDDDGRHGEDCKKEGRLPGQGAG